MINKKASRLMLPIPFGEFYRSIGISRSTAYRFRKAGWIKTIQISERLYVLPSEVAEFTRRSERGDFATGELKNPSKSKPKRDKAES